MNKKNYLIAAMALPLFMAACSSEDVLTEVQENSQYPGVAQVNAQFGIEAGAGSRLATEWRLENNDVVGLAWLGTGSGENADVLINGKAYQNHPLYSVNEMLQPKTSIYVGKYFSYYPYDYATKSVGAINFSIAEQPLNIVVNNNVNAAAAKSIWISPKWTNVTEEGWTDTDDNTYNNAGVDKTFMMYPRKFSNMVQLVLTYVNNNLPLADTPDIKGIKVSYVNGETTNSVTSFTYAPTAEENASEEVAMTYWESKTLQGSSDVAGLTETTGAITLNGTCLAEGAGHTFVYNALPANAEVTDNTEVKLEFTTTYGVVTIQKPLAEIAKSYDAEVGNYRAYYDGEKVEGELKGVSLDKSFVNVLYKNGKLITDVDFKKAVMDGMHVENDAELQKMLNYYKNYKMPSTDITINEVKNGETDIKLFLDGSGESKIFELSKTSIALIQEINKNCVDELLVSIQGCTDQDKGCAGCSAVNITGEGEVPELNKVFESEEAAAATSVNLAAGAWTWTTTPVATNGQLNDENTGKNFGYVKTINVASGATLTLSNGNIKAVGEFNGITNQGNIVVDVKAHIKFSVTNNNTITISENGQMLAYGATITNNSYGYYKNGISVIEYRIINNGVLGIVDGTEGLVNNYGYIKNGEGARTYVSSNQTSGASFANKWSSNNQMGTIELTNWNDKVSVINANKEGFIKYTWTGETTYETPGSLEDVAYNYLIVNKDIEFTAFESEVQYLEVAAGSKIEITAVNVFDGDHRLNGLILGDGATVDIDKGKAVYAWAAYIHNAEIYLGGEFYYNKDLVTYLGGEDSDINNIVTTK